VIVRRIGRQVVAVFVSMLIAACSTTPSVGTSPGPLPSHAALPAAPSPSPAAPSPSATRVPQPLGWRPAPIQESFRGVALGDVVWTGARFIASGTDYVAGKGIILDSLDGLTWHRQALDLGLSEVRKLEVGPRGIVAIGDEESSLASWASEDGLTWSKRADAFGDSDPEEETVTTVFDIVASVDGWVAIGTEHPACVEDFCPPPIRTVVWTSGDGLAWARVVDAATVDDAWMFSIAGGGPGYVAVGWAGDHAAVWTSPDGRSWSRIPDGAQFHPPIDAGPSVKAWMSSIVTFGGEMVAFGSIGETYGEIEPAAWWSGNGTDWSLMDHDWPDDHGVGIFSAGPNLTLTIGDREDDGCLGVVSSLTPGSLREFITTYRWVAPRCASTDTAQFGFGYAAIAASTELIVAVGVPGIEGEPAVWVHSIP
jgi:hypothetical protein